MTEIIKTRTRMSSPVALALCLMFASAAAPNLFAGAYFNGFELDTANWVGVTRVASGVGGVPSASGSFHAEAPQDGSAFTRWGGYNDDPACAGGGVCPGTFPAGGFDTSIDIYLDVDAGYSNDARFDFSSAINQPDGNHRRDFIFSCGFYSDAVAPGSGNRFVCSASNNSPGWPKNPGREPTVVAVTTGWYTFLHEFRDDGFGVLTVDLSVLDSSGTAIHTWTLSDPTDIIGATVGGNRYGWFVNNVAGAGGSLPALAIDNTRRSGHGPMVSCVGSGVGLFEVPLDQPVTVNKRARVLPFRMALVDDGGNELTDVEIGDAPPIIQVTVAPGYGGDPPPPATLESSGKGDEGNVFSFSGSQWAFNLKTSNFSGAGMYSAAVVSGDPSAYVVDPSCVATFHITR